MAVEGERNTNRMIAKAEPEGLTFKLIKTKLLQNWKWFASLSLVGAVLAFVNYKTTPPYFQISSTILIKNDGRTSEMNNIFRDFNPNVRNPDIEDQVGVLKSYNLNFRTLQYLNWKYSWSKEDWFQTKDLYGNDPFELVLPDEAIQIESVPIEVKLLPDQKVLISCDQVAKKDGIDVHINFKQEVKLGEEFRNENFHFSLNENPNYHKEVGDRFILVFNNINKMALGYKERLEVKPANPLSSSNLILVGLVTNQLKRDVDYLNQLGRIYLQFGLDEKNRIANNTIKFIDDQITGVNQSLQSAGDQFSSFRARNRTVDLGQEASAVVDKLKQIEVERGNLEMKLDYYNNLKFYLQNRDQNEDLVAPSLVGVSDDALSSKVLDLNELYKRREVLSYTAQERNPMLISLNNQIEYIQKSLMENVDNLIANTKIEIQSLNERQRNVNYELSKLPKTEQDLIGIKRNFDLNNELYTFLLQRRAEAEIAKASNNPDAQILDPTDPQIAAQLGPLLTINLAIGLLAGFFVALGIVVFKELVNEVITDVDEITSRLAVSVIGSIGLSRYKTEIPVLRYPRSSIAESFRGLRVNLEFILGKEKGQVLAVHSYASGEGKSFVTVNLALIFAQSGRRVLLVDGDLRKSRLHRILETENSDGLSEFLSGKSPAKQIIKNTKFKNLDFVSTGSTTSNVTELLRRDLVKEFLGDIRNDYDLIVVDNSPFGIIHDPIVIGSCADFNLILLRLNQSRKSEIDTINRFGHEGIISKIIVAVNGVKQSKGHGYYTDNESESENEAVETTGTKEEPTQTLSKSAAVFMNGVIPLLQNAWSKVHWNKPQ